MVLPLHYLDSQILASDEVTDLQLFVRFHGAALNEAIPPTRFEVKKQLAAKTVGHFISLPEPMASELIGEQVAGYELMTSRGERLANEHFDGNLHVMLFATGQDANNHVQQITRLKRELKNEPYQWSVVYADELLQSPGGDSLELAEPFRATFEAPDCVCCMTRR